MSISVVKVMKDLPSISFEICKSACFNGVIDRRDVPTKNVPHFQLHCKNKIGKIGYL